ncbi:glycine-rich domain-containing protein [Pantoea ananatis]|uniref:glycine-rich domain-containing protein n=1 Tax=Pantoea ananas TaxID=553 RepID=UPI00188F98AE|nr:hypothetical protein [Pantoea ananatis]
MAQNNFKPFAIGNGANVSSQADYEALAALASGFQSGKASSAQINKALRQSTVMAYVLAQFISDSTTSDVLDDGNPATILANLKSGMTALTPGRLINVQILTSSGTYVPSSGTKKIIVEVIGGGGGSGGLGGTGTNQVVISAGGGSGTYARVLISNPTQTSVTVGTGGAGGLGQNGATGGRGGNSVFGTFVTVEGGFGSSVGLSKAMPAFGIPTSGSPQLTYANCTLLSFSYGGAGTPGFVTANGDAVAGAGGTSFFGLGGDGNGSKGTGRPGISPGSGGGGVCVSDSSYGQTTTGARGADGICVIWEYS